jgi:hypothetical protein
VGNRLVPVAYSFRSAGVHPEWPRHAAGLWAIVAGVTMLDDPGAMVERAKQSPGASKPNHDCEATISYGSATAAERAGVHPRRGAGLGWGVETSVRGGGTDAASVR